VATSLVFESYETVFRDNEIDDGVLPSLKTEGLSWPAVPDKISQGAANMEDHETRRKIFANGWRFRRISDTPKNRLRHSLKRRPSKTSSIAVDAIRTTNFGAIHTRKSWDGSYLAVASRMSEMAAL
jgi:hypothetical protein